MKNQNNWVLVTGGAKGIGWSISKRLAKAGHSLILVGRDLKVLQSRATEIQKKFKTSVHVIALDLSQPNTASELFRTLKGLGVTVPSALVCNAGDYGTLGALTEVKIKDWKKSFNLNFFSQVSLIQKYLRQAQRSPSLERRKIILLSGGGLGGSHVWPNISAYACSKAALYRFMEVLHEETHHLGFDINCVAPGAVKTGITDQAEKAGKSILGDLYDTTVKIQTQGGDSPELAAEVIADLISPRCDGLSGRLLSAKWDGETLKNPKKIMEDKDLLRLRRIDNELFRSTK